jgi:hypothetical protein
MSIAEGERLLAPGLNYNPASVDEAAAGNGAAVASRPGYGGFESDVWRVKIAAPKKLR